MSAVDEPALAGFWIGGFEGADHVNGRGLALDLVAASGHVEQLEADHARAAAAGLACVRESIGWRLAEPMPGEYDFARALRIQASARRHGLQVLWTLMHYGLPADLSLHDDALVPRFARFARAAARALAPANAPSDDRAPVFTPINEISFLGWAASMPDLLAPPNNLPPEAGASHAATSRISGYRVKRRLVRAVLAAIEAIRSVCPQARFMHVEPLVHVVPPPGRPDLAPQADTVASWQWQAWDLLCGRLEPELGGHAAALDIVGVNHYHSSQWELGTERRLRWHEQDPRRRPLAELLKAAWERYRRPLVLAETSHVGAGRAAWMHDVAAQARQAVAQGVPLRGLCLYPLVDRPDWDEPTRWHRSGLWHAGPTPATQRVVDPPYLAALRAWQHEAAAQPPVLLALIKGRHDAWPTRGWQLLSRLAGRWRVVVLESPRPAHDDGVPRLDVVCAGPQLDVLVPRGASDGLLQRLLQGWWRSRALPLPLLWLADDEAAALSGQLPRRAMVCDLGEGRSVAQAFATADLVLVREVSHAYDERMRLLPDGTDDQFFGNGPYGGWDAEEAATVQRSIAGPRLGCAVAQGVCIDASLVARVATARPGWQFVFCAAVPGELELPALPNVHRLPPLPYRVLPDLMDSWQAAWLPLRRAQAPALPGAAECAALGLPWVRPGDGGVDWLAACDQAMARQRGVRLRNPGADWSRRADAAHRWLQTLQGASA